MKQPNGLIDEWGILSEFKDAFGKRRVVSQGTHDIIRRAMGDREPPRGTAARPAVLVLTAGAALALPGPAELRLEDGAVRRVQKRLPPGLPPGYHELTDLSSGERTWLMIAPRACYLPPEPSLWGWAIQLYALRSARSWGMGDLADLREFTRWTARELGCGFCLVNPIGAATPILPQQASPYYPGSRCFWNLLYLRLEEVPGARSLGPALEKLAQAGRALNASRRIDRDAVFRLKFEALEKLWARFEGHPDFDRFCEAAGATLFKFAAFGALARRFQAGWPRWPAEFRTPDSPGVRDYVRHHHNEIRFFQWQQWLLYRQLKGAAAPLRLIQDLPIGVDPGGADAWIWQDLLAPGVQIGAPPDAYNAQGQNWGMQPFNPHRLRDAFFEPIRLTIRAALQYGGGLRIDHVMGLFRLFWIPEGKSGQEGAYVHYPADELLAILAIESHRARALVIGEDLGTVEPRMRRELRRRNVLSYRLLWFESKPVRRYPRKALTAISTHDLYTLAGFWHGTDLAEQEQLGLRPDAGERRKLLRRLCRRLRLSEKADLKEVILKTHALVARTPSMLLAASLDDALEVDERPNMPGTSGRPNWCLGLPVPLREVKKSPLIREVSAAIRQGRKTGK